MLAGGSWQKQNHHRSSIHHQHGESQQHNSFQYSIVQAALPEGFAQA
jgi:hypothetical protein